jgi:hypothetical protein
MILEKQELFTPVFSEVPYMTNDHREAGTVTGINSFCLSMIIRHATNLTENGGKQFLLLYDHPSCNEPH